MNLEVVAYLKVLHGACIHTIAENDKGARNDAEVERKLVRLGFDRFPDRLGLRMWASILSKIGPRLDYAAVWKLRAKADIVEKLWQDTGKSKGKKARFDATHGFFDSWFLGAPIMKIKAPVGYNDEDGIKRMDG